MKLSAFSVFILSWNYFCFCIVYIMKLSAFSVFSKSWN